MSGEWIVATLVESHAAVLRTRGIELAQDVVEEMARNAAAILHAELQAEADDAEHQEFERELASLPSRIGDEIRAALGGAVPEAIDDGNLGMWRRMWGETP